MSSSARVRWCFVGVLVAASACAKTEPIQSPKIDRAKLSSGTCPIIHCDTYQSDALPMRGPEAPSQVRSLPTDGVDKGAHFVPVQETLASVREATGRAAG